MFHAMYIRRYWYWWNIDEGYIPFMISIPAIQVARSYRSNILCGAVSPYSHPADIKHHPWMLPMEIPYFPTKPWSGL